MENSASSEPICVFMVGNGRESLKAEALLHSASSDSETKSGKAISTLPVLESNL
jgi:hypothetical protein